MNRESGPKTVTDTDDLRLKAGYEYSKYPITSWMLFITIAISLIYLSIAIVRTFTADQQPFKIEIDSNSSSATAQNQTALSRPFKKIYEYLTSAESDEASAPSFKMNVITGKTDTGIGSEKCFIVFITVLICGLGILGLKKEEPLFLLPFLINFLVFAGMIIFLLISFSNSAIETDKKNQPSFNSTCIGENKYNMGLIPTLWVILTMVACAILFLIGVYISDELYEMGTTNMGKTQRPKEPHQATSNAKNQDKMSRVSNDGTECE